MTSSNLTAEHATTENYDLCIIGAGPAGFSAAMRAVDFNKRICIIEHSKMGGAGVFWGALVSKTLWELSEDYDRACRVDRGYRASNITVDYPKVLDTAATACKEKQYQMLSAIETYAPDKNKNSSITLIRGHAKFLDNSRIEVQTEDKQVRLVCAEHFIIATGSRPRPFTGIAVDQEKIRDTNGILALKEFPRRLLIVGAGIIGCEFATIFSNYKQTEVHLLDHAEHIIPFEDPDISEYISNNLEQNGVRVHHLAKLRKAVRVGDYLECTVDFKDGRSRVLEADQILLAIGRVPATDDLGLENTSVQLTERSHIKVDEHCKGIPCELTTGTTAGTTTACNIYAAGDVTGSTALVNVAEMEGRYIVEKIWGEQPVPLNVSNMPTIMFFKPEVAAVGINERKAREQGLSYRMSFYSNQLLPRAISMRSTTGFVKILISNDGEDKILGMRAAGPQASALIMNVAYLKDTGNSIHDYLKTIHPHPCMTESILESLRLFQSSSISKPEVFPELCYTKEWNPGDAEDTWHTICKLY